MKKNILFLTLLFCSALMAQEKNEQIIKSDVSEATVFIKGAQVVRKKAIVLKAGRNTLRFTGLSPYIDGKSVQFKANNEIMVLSVNHQLCYTDSVQNSGEQQKLYDKMDALDDKIQLQKTNLDIIAKELDFLNENRKINGSTQSTSLINLKETANYYRERISSLKLKELEIKKLISQLEAEKQVLDHQERALGEIKPTPSGEIIVKLEVKTATTSNIELSYFVNNVGWFPSYDIRSNSIEEPLELIYKANINQNSKEDWKNIKLRISSANPNIGNVAPVLKPYLLNYYTLPPRYDVNANNNMVSGRVCDAITKSPLIGVNVTVSGSTIGTITNVEGQFTLSIPEPNAMLQFSYLGYKPQNRSASPSMLVQLSEDSKTLDEVVVLGYSTNANSNGFLDQSVAGSASGIKIRGTASLNTKDKSIPIPVNQVENQTSVEFEIKNPYSISSGQNLTVDMENYQMKADYEYFAVPKVCKDAFLLANITNWEKYNLLEGEANIFFENTFIGKTALDTRHLSDTLSISLGRDKNVWVQREKLKENSRKQFLSSKKEESRSWKLQVRNNKKQSIQLTLLDQIPVATMEEIEVTTETASGASVDHVKGEVKWKLTLQPTDKKELLLKYSVKYPKGQNLIVE